jgi:hypothetical protein
MESLLSRLQIIIDGQFNHAKICVARGAAHTMGPFIGPKSINIGSLYPKYSESPIGTRHQVVDCRDWVPCYMYRQDTLPCGLRPLASCIA